MPLLTSPIDGSPMRQIRRYGVELDVCPTSGGIWLDKGELEKLLHLLREEVEAESRGTSPSYQAYQAAPPPSHGGYARHHDDDDDERHYREKGYYGSGKYHKKEGKMSRLMDLFDF